MYLGAFSTLFPERLVSVIVTFGAEPVALKILKSVYRLSIKLIDAKRSRLPYGCSIWKKRVIFILKKPSIPLFMVSPKFVLNMKVPLVGSSLINCLTPPILLL